MKKTLLGAVIAAILLALVALFAGNRLLRRGSDGVADASIGSSGEVHPSLLYGRVTTVNGAIHEGRLRFGGNQEAFWGDYFNGVKQENPWAAHVPAGRLPKERHRVGLLGVEIGEREHVIELKRPYMVRFGDIARIEAHNHDVQVTLKGGTTSMLDRLSASDFDDGVRVWDDTGGLVTLDNKWIRRIELLPSPRTGAAPYRLHGTVRTRNGDTFTGFLQWDRKEALGVDKLEGRAGGQKLSLRFDSIRSISRESEVSARVALLDGRELVLSDSREIGRDNLGIYVDDPRYGRVLISWEAFERVDLGAAGAGPSYADYPATRPLTGSVITRDGRRLTGRLVYDLDESESVETLDAPREGVDYTIPFGLIASVAPRGDGASEGLAKLTLRGGEVLELERRGDLGAGHAGMLIFIEGRERPEYVQWTDVRQVELDTPSAMYPPPVTPQ